MASGTAHTLLLPYLPIRLPLPACHAAASLFFYSFHRVHAVARPFMPHDQQQFVYEYLINPQLTHQWTQPIGALRPDAPHRDWAGCAIQPSIHPSIHPLIYPLIHPCAIWNVWEWRQVRGRVWVRLANAKRVERIRTWRARIKSTFIYASLWIHQWVFVLFTHCIFR